MTRLGIVLMIICGGISLMMFLGIAPEALYSLPVGLWAWIGGAIAGLVLVILNRRPAN